MAYTTIDDPTDYFSIVLYTGNAGTQSITGVGFSPSLVWIKSRNDTNSHYLFDTVRGVHNPLIADHTTAENADTDTLTSFDSDGFSIGDNTGINGSSDTEVVWNWKSGTSFSNDASSTGIGSIDSSGIFSNDAGFSIVSFVGTGSNATVKHGLNSAPALIFFKDRSATKDWFVYHQSYSPATGGKLNLDVNPSSDSTYFQNTATTSSVFSIGSANTVNASSNNMIAYCFAEKKGYSKFGSYVANGNSDNAFVYTGFKPAFVIIKLTSHSGGGWEIVDNKRDGFNGENHRLYANEYAVEGSGNDYDLLSNGFKVRQSGGSQQSGRTNIYMAFAESPFVNSNGVPNNAR